jgi:hypothetical protein
MEWIGFGGVPLARSSDTVNSDRRGRTTPRAARSAYPIQENALTTEGTDRTEKFNTERSSQDGLRCRGKLDRSSRGTTTDPNFVKPENRACDDQIRDAETVHRAGHRARLTTPSHVQALGDHIQLRRARGEKATQQTALSELLHPHPTNPRRSLRLT